MKIVLASLNKHKVKEINEIIRNLTNNQEIEFVLPPEGFDPVEDGETFEENSYIKERAAWEIGHWLMIPDFVLMHSEVNRGFILLGTKKLRKRELTEF